MAPEGWGHHPSRRRRGRATRAGKMTQRIDDLAAAIKNRDRAALPRAITLVESTRADHREQAQRLLLELTPHAGSALEPEGRRHPPMHVGITGVPGVGKSTAIEALGMHLIEQGHRVAVLAVDPSSTRTGGSILGDRPGWRIWRCIPMPTSGRRRRRAPSAAWPGPPGKPSCCSRRPASTSSWWRPSVSGSPRWRWPTWWTPSCS